MLKNSAWIAMIKTKRPLSQLVTLPNIVVYFATSDSNFGIIQVACHVVDGKDILDYLLFETIS